MNNEKLLQGFIYGFSGLLILLLVFKTGEFVGLRKGSFSCRWGENYHRNFGGPQSGFFNEFQDNNFINANGVFGQIIKIEGQTIVVKSQNEMEKVVLIKENTVIEKFKDKITYSDLKFGDYVMIIGEPNNQGQIEANLIRIMPIPLSNRPKGMFFNQI
ncbi:MAG: hypothetical protein PHE77_03600 [Candidatus Pacebacteria bacterium]|nr:hypothetical protein [Candidatus Paceibacterota bacterium]